MASSDFYDLPFIYTFNANDLTDGQDYDRLQVPIIADSEFHLRRIAGAATLADYNGGAPGATSRFMVYTQGGSRIFSKPELIEPDMALVPELVYPPGGQIRFDVSDLFRARNAGGGGPAYFSQLSFQGVRRYYGMSPLGSSYKYYEKPQAYPLTFGITYANGTNFRRYVQSIENFDFSLHAISIVTLAGGSGEVPDPGVWAVVDPGQFSFYLYNKNSERLSIDPVDAATYAFNRRKFAVSTGGGVFPCPPVLYPVGSQIMIDVYSNTLAASLPLQVQMVFHGVWRLPCR
jgi:hypothetical protein